MTRTLPLYEIEKYYIRAFHPCFYGTGEDKHLFMYNANTEVWYPSGFKKELAVEAVRDFKEISEDEFNKLLLVRKLTK